MSLCLDVVSVVAGGWSVKGDHWSLEGLPGTVIGVNDSALYLPKVHVVVSMDRLWTEHRWDWLCQRKLPAWIRIAAMKNIRTRGLPLSWLNVFECDHTKVEFSDNPKTLNGTNSGMCAFNLAYTMMPDTIFLFGFDYCNGPNNEQHWFPDYPWKSGHSTKPPTLKQWSSQFRVVAKQCRDAGILVVNCSTRSLITDFRKQELPAAGITQ